MPSLIIPFHEYTNLSLNKTGSLSKFARSLSLQISNYDQVGNKMLGLDASRKKLLYANNSTGSSSLLIVDLNHLEICTVKKEYRNILPGKLKTRKLHQFLITVYLNLVFKYGFGTISLPFFDAREERQKNTESMEAKAIKWSALISKLLPGLKLKTAGTDLFTTSSQTGSIKPLPSFDDASFSK